MCTLPCQFLDPTHAATYIHPCPVSTNYHPSLLLVFVCCQMGHAANMDIGTL